MNIIVSCSPSNMRRGQNTDRLRPQYQQYATLTMHEESAPFWHLMSDPHVHTLFLFIFVLYFFSEKRRNKQNTLLLVWMCDVTNEMDSLFFGSFSPLEGQARWSSVTPFHRSTGMTSSSGGEGSHFFFTHNTPTIVHLPQCEPRHVEYPKVLC